MLPPHSSVTAHLLSQAITNLSQPVRRVSSSEAKLHISFKFIANKLSYYSNFRWPCLWDQKEGYVEDTKTWVQKWRLAQVRWWPRGQEAGRYTFCYVLCRKTAVVVIKFYIILSLVLDSNRSGFENQFCYFSDVWRWASYFTRDLFSSGECHQWMSYKACCKDSMKTQVTF